MCKLAIDRDPTTLELVRNQTEKLCHRAIYRSVSMGAVSEHFVVTTLALIREQTEALCMYAIRAAPVDWAITRDEKKLMSRLLSAIRVQTLPVCMAAYRYSRWILHSVRSPSLQLQVERCAIAEIVQSFLAVDLSTALLVEIIEALLPTMFPVPGWAVVPLPTPVQLWRLVAAIKHARGPTA